MVDSGVEVVVFLLNCACAYFGFFEVALYAINMTGLAEGL